MFYKSVANAIAHSSIPWRTHYLWNHWFRCIFRKLKLETWFYANIEAWMRTSKERGSNPLKFEESYYPKFSTQSLRLFHFRQKFDYSCSYFVLNLLASFLHYHIFNAFTCSLRYNARPSQRFLELEFRRSVIFRFKDDAVASYWIIVVLCRKYFWLVQDICFLEDWVEYWMGLVPSRTTRICGAVLGGLSIALFLQSIAALRHFASFLLFLEPGSIFRCGFVYGCAFRVERQGLRCAVRDCRCYSAAIAAAT